MDISMVDLKNQYERIRPELDHAISQVMASASFINGPSVSDFSRNIANYLDVRYVIPCANGTDALQVALMAFGFKKGTEILVPSWTYIATVEVIALLGFTPIFVEVDPDTFLIDLNDLRQKISTDSVAIIPVHLYGQCADMNEINKIAAEHELKVIEDAAQAFGADYISNQNNLKAGTMGDIGITSFFPSKNLGCYGDGGAIFTNDEDLAFRVKMIANHGQSKKYIHDVIGVNSRLDSIQAAILNVKLKYLDDYTKARQEVAEYYSTNFANMESLKIPKQVSNSTHVFHQYTLKVDPRNRDQLKSGLAKAGIPTMIYYPLPCHLQKAYSYFGNTVGDLPITEVLSDQVLSLPIHTEMTREILNYISKTVKKIVA